MSTFKILLPLTFVIFCSILTIRCTTTIPPLTTVNSQILLESSSVNDRGDWGNSVTCSGNLDKSFVVGFQLRVDYRDPFNEDNTALNGIWLACGNPFRAQTQSEDDLQSRQTTEWISSANSSFGQFQRRLFCGTDGGGYAVGFQLKSQQDQGPHMDDVGAVNLKMICADGDEVEGYEENENLYPDAEYTEAVKCPQKMGVCGIQTQVEQIKWGDDNTALNNIRIVCCPIPEEIAPSTTTENDDLTVTIIADSEDDSSLQQRVKLFESQKGRGTNESIAITSGQCNPIPERWFGKVGSLEYKADCIRIWETSQCSGHTRCHCDEGFLSLDEETPMSKNVSSWQGRVSALSMCKVENSNFTSFRLFSGKEFQDPSEYLVLIPHECLTFYGGDNWRGKISNIFVVDGCVEYFEEEECIGNSMGKSIAYESDVGSENREYEMVKSLRNCATDNK